MSNTIRIDDDVDAYIRHYGKFGESHSDVLRRLLPDFDAFLTAPTAKERPANANTRKRYLWHGHEACRIIRRLDKEGWTKAEIRKVFNSYDELRKVSDTTITCQTGKAGKKRGPPAEMTVAEVEELSARK
jgi:hypothetical protein